MYPLASVRQLGGMGRTPVLGGISFPYDFDPTGLSAFPAGWTGSETFVISSDVISNSPTLGDELLTDPGIEGTFTDGANGNLVITGGTATEVTSGVHGGSKAQGWEPTAAYQAIVNQITSEATSWYKALAWFKRVSGSASNIFSNPYVAAMTASSRMLTSATYVQLGGVIYANAAESITDAIAYANGTGDAIVLDDKSLKKLTKTSMVKLVQGAAGYTAKIRVTTWDTNSLVGVVSHSDGTLDNCLIAYYAVAPSNAYTYCALDQFVAGVRTNLVATWSNSPGSGSGQAPTSAQWLEIRYTGANEVTLYHNDIAIGAAQTIPVGLRANDYYGIIDAGGNSVNRFFAGELQAVNIGAAGSSNTVSATGYFYKLWNDARPKYLVTKLNAAANGQGIATYGLAHYGDLAGSVQVVFDTTGDNTYPDHLWSVEAFIRKCHADGYKVLAAVLPTWTDADLNNGQVNTPMNQTAMEALISLFDHYGITYFDGWAYTQAHVTGGGNISDLWEDQYHPLAVMQYAISDGLAPSYVTGGSFTLASRVYPESEALE